MSSIAAGAVEAADGHLDIDIDAWLEFCTSALQPALARRHHAAGAGPVLQKVADAVHKSGFLLGDSLSAADIAVGSLLLTQNPATLQPTSLQAYCQVSLQHI